MEGHFADCICKLCCIRRRKSGKKGIPCKFHLEDRCRHTESTSSECSFAHLSFEEIPPCPFGSNCKFGPTKCLFLHDTLRDISDFFGDGGYTLPQPDSWIPAAPKVRNNTKKKRKKKKKNTKNRLVESNPDSQPSQNPFQPLSMEEEKAAESDSESEGESE